MAKPIPLLEWMRTHGKDAYGSVITAAEVDSVLGIVEPKRGTRATFKAIEIERLGATDAVRKALLQEGKYLQQTGDSYRILLPSENMAQFRKYTNQAIGKLKRGDMLLKNTPLEGHDSLAATRERARMVRWADSAKEAQNRGDTLQ